MALDLIDARADAPYQAGVVYSSKFLGRDGDRVLFAGGPTAKGHAPAKLLERFLKLARGVPNDVEQFAKRWGGLSLCSAHGLPHHHSVNCSEKQPFGETNHTESIEAWIRAAKFFESLLRIAISFEAGNRGSDDDWGVVDLFTGIDFPTSWSSREIINSLPELHIQRENAITQYFQTVRYLIAMGRITLRFWWSDKKNRFQVDLDSPFHSSNLFGILTVQLLPLLANPTGRLGFAICSDCGRTYRVDRKPNPNRRSYCERCKKSAWKDSKRDRRRQAQLTKPVPDPPG